MLLKSWVLSFVLIFSGIYAARGAGVDGNLVIEYSAPAVGLTLKCTVLLPADYERSHVRYPVLYLLHGHSGNFRSWLTYAHLPVDAATRLGAIIVLPDGGNAFYTDWQGAIGSRPQRWEAAITKDLIPMIDQRFRTQRDRAHRAIGGLSMGGYGAITIALRHPDMFVAAFSSAGALGFAAHAREELASGKEDWNRPDLWKAEDKPVVDIAGFGSQEERTPRGQVFRTAEQTKVADPYLLAASIPSTSAPYIHLDCGTRDPSIDESRKLAAILHDRKMRYSYLELPGDHDPPYWAEAFEHTLLIVKRQLGH